MLDAEAGGQNAAPRRQEGNYAMPDLVLRAATLIDGTGAEPQRPGAVTIRDGQIAAVGAPGRDAGDAEIMDFGDATLLPGLIDAHVHLQFTAGPDHPTTRGIHMHASDAERIATAIGNAQRGLATGVTTMRDTGGYLTLNMDVRDAINDGHVVGPRLLVCGAPITTTAGHLHWCGLRADSRDEVVEAVRTMVEAGADFVKVMATGGMMTPGTSPGMTQYSDTELRALVNDAHRLRKQVAAHVLGTTGCILAIDAGVDTLEHCSWLDESGALGTLRFDAEAAARVSPATQSVHMTIGAGNREVVRGLANLDELSEAGREELRTRGIYHRAMRASGTPMVVSSDAGVMTTAHDEFALTVIAAVGVLDLSPVEAVNLTTYAPASTIGLGEVTGALKPGLAADVLVVEGDAADNICRVGHPLAVYLGGLEVARERRLITA